jgi:hypothetical protein
MHGAVPPLPEYAFMVWYFVKHSDNFTEITVSPTLCSQTLLEDLAATLSKPLQCTRIKLHYFRRVSQEIKELKKNIYCKYTEMNLMLLFNVIPLDFNAPVPAFQKFFFNSVRKRVFGCVFNQFCTAPMTSSSDESLLPFRASFIGPNMEIPGAEI